LPNSKETWRKDFQEWIRPGDEFIIRERFKSIFLGFSRCKWSGGSGSCVNCKGLIKYADTQNRADHSEACLTSNHGRMLDVDLTFNIETRKILDDELFEI